MPAILRSRQSDDSRFSQLIDGYHAASGTARQQLEHRILSLVESNFKRELKPLVARALGQKAVAENADVSCRYTVMVNEFFAKQVLDQRRSEFWKARALQDVRKWASRVITNHFRDYLRRKRRGEEILEQHIAPLVERFRDHFERHHGMEYEAALAHLDAWSASDALRDRQMADAVRYRYVDGMTYEEIAEQMGVSPKAVDNLRTRAIGRLREFVSSC